jgi:PAS domain-containing protein
LSQQNYLLFHTFVEIFSIVTAIAIFAIAWNTRRLVDNSYFKIIGIALLFVAILALIHTLAYKGMGVFPDVAANLATQLWIATRYLLSFSFLVPLLLIHHKVKSSIVFAGYAIVTALILLSIYLEVFPQAYNDLTQQLTLFKVGSEYVISAIMVVSIVALIKKRREFSERIFKLLLTAMVLAIATEMAFTLYTDVYGISNMIGHLVNIGSFYCIYIALVETSLTNPFELLFRNLKQSELSLANRAQELTEVNDRLEQEIAERKAIEEALRESEERLQFKLDSVLSCPTAEN